MSPKSRGRPTPSTVRFAHRSTRGKPAQPSSLDAPRAPAGPTVVALHDLTRFPAPAAWGAGATPPTASPPALGPAATRRRSATCRRLTCGSPRLPAVRLGRTHLQGLRAGMPLPHFRPVAERGSPASPGCRPATTRLPACVCRGTDCCQTVRGVAATLCRDNRLRRMSLTFRLPSPPPIPGDAHPGQPTGKGLRHSVRPFSRSLTGCGLGCALAVRPFAVGA